MSTEQHEPDSKPRTEASEPASTAPPREHRVARLSWRVGAHEKEVDLSGGEGLLLIPVSTHGAKLASALIDGLDRAAAGGRHVVSVDREPFRIALDLPPNWPAARRLPSVVLAGEGRGPAPSRATAPGLGGGDEWVRGVLERLGKRDALLLRDFPRRRRALAAARRQLESRLLRHDEQHHRVRRRARWALGSAGLGLLAAMGGAFVTSVTLMLVGALIFFVAAVVVALERAARHERLHAREQLERQLTGVALQGDEAEIEAHRLAVRAGANDPWQASSRLAAMPLADEIAPGIGVDRAEVLALARRLAREMGERPETLAWEQAWKERWRVAGAGWPDELSPTREASPASRLLRAGQLLARVRESLPEPWPIVLWNPWSQLDAEERARSLLAVSRVVGTRPVLVITPA
ncbi:MAG: hypothetical protein JSV80_14710 [Acidobacteriota bacterium]|nr:MAG: hypothetical protein JSV80_14710 [Acidobacteriota bacterium]